MGLFNKRSIVFLLVAVLMNCTGTKSSKEKSLVVAGASPILVSSEFSFTEGPAVDKDGNIYFTDQPNNRIHKWTPEMGVTVFMENAGRANGLYFDAAGNLLACADENNELWSIDPQKKVTVIVKDFNDKKLNGPNDLWVAPDGSIFFTDPFYKRNYWTRAEKEIPEENVYYLSPDRKTLKIAMGDFVRPNGIVGTPDGKKLYVADIGAGKTFSFDINASGALSNRQLFASMGSDGMTIDRKGNVYLTGKGVTIFDRAGKQVGHIPIPENWTANVCFGGRDMKTLFVTASKSVYTVAMTTRGVAAR